MYSVKNSFKWWSEQSHFNIYKMIKREQEIRGKGDYSKANFASWYVVP
jgi:hypothetical protein